MGRNLSWSPGLTGAIARPGTATAGPVAGVRLRRVFAGEASQLASVREWLASLLPPGEVRADVISIATELGSNAVKHTASGQGGSFEVELTCNPFAVRVAVADGGRVVWADVAWHREEPSRVSAANGHSRGPCP